jgi:predicted Ser/Thr protein kinase
VFHTNVKRGSAVFWFEMPQCRGCAAEISEASRFCPHCGVPAGGPVLVTATIASPRPARSDARSSAEFISSSSADEGRFLPGTLLADRYRIIGPLGKGGMGEVYRATDIRLGQTVALKFLPGEAAHDPGKLARFHNEVRIARQVTHPNVCRVYDIGEVDGLPFLSMEFVDGEDLASLLRRIGRLPQDKAIEIARKLCAGLSAAHSQGVLHRDLKPANIMIDGRGQVVITDFGLAGLAAELQNGDIRSGTPAYMAPEQLSGKEVSVQSDLYSLGLVLYEVFTGKKAFEANTLAEMIRLREEGPPPSVTSLVRDIDPSVERAIIRCLDPDPRKRPQSAVAVSAALPGGDPLAAALAAGETPSPEMVAAAGATEGLRPAAAIACLAGIIIGLFALVTIFSQEMIAGKMRLEMPPDALAFEARRIVQRLGYAATPADRASGFDYASDYLRYLYDRKGPRPDWIKIANGQPSPINFWYRQSPRPLEAEGSDRPGEVTLSDPPQRISGMISVSVDTAGRLVELEAVPPQVEQQTAAPQPLDPAPLFAAAGLDLAQFKSADPKWTPPQMADARAAWTGTFLGRPENAIRVEAASWRGKPVYFQIIGPWTQPSRMQAEQASRSDRVNQLLWISLFLVMLVAGSLVAWRNLRLGRGDRQGAFRIAALSFVLTLGIWLFGAHHVAWPGEFGLFTNAIAQSLLTGAELWIAYIALEPFVRRHWPATIITWTRTVGGGLRDPLVGRDLLIGLLVGLGYDLAIAAGIAIDLRQGHDGPATSTQLSTLLGFAHFTSGYLNHARDALVGSLLLFLVFFLLRVILRREWLAAIAFVAMFSARGLASENPAVETCMYVVIYGILVGLLLRYGFLAVLVCIFVTDLLIQIFFTPDLTAWYGIPSLLTLISLIAVALFAFRTSTAGKPLFGGLLDR